MSGALLLGVDAIVWADARDTPATDELRARWPHELWLPQSHKSSRELVVSDDARVSSEAAAPPIRWALSCQAKAQLRP
jgi:hypothetical protein